MGFESGAESDVDLEQRACDAVSNSTRLSAGSATGHIDTHIELARGLGDGESLLSNDSLGIGEKVAFELSSVDGDLAGTRRDSNTSHRCFASSGSEFVLLFLSHVKWMLNRGGFDAIEKSVRRLEGLWLLRAVGMFRSAVNFELSQELRT